MRRKIEKLDRYVKPGAAAACVVLMAGLAGWGGSTIALSGASTTSAAASRSTAAARPLVSPATPSDTTTHPTASTPPAPSGTTSSASSPARGTGAAPPISSAPPPVSSSLTTLPRGTVQAPAPPPPPPYQYEPDIAFVGPSRDSSNGQWYYRVGLLGFPADTVVEISGYDTYGNVQVAPLAMTTAEGSWNPFTAGFAVNFAYGGTCGAAEPKTVTARGHGFSVTETAPRPLECDGDTTPDGPWTRPIHPAPSPSPAPASPWTSGSGGA